MGPMEILRVITFVVSTLKISIDEWKNLKKLGGDMELGLNNLMNRLDNLRRGLEKEGWESYDELLVTELVYDIEDFAQGLSTPGASDYFLSAIGMGRCENYVARINNFQNEIDNKLATLRKKSSESKPKLQGGGSDPASSSAAAAGGYTPEESLVGITKPKDAILELLEKPASSEEAEKPKVISIVGCPGVGKTALARVVYDHYVNSCDFDCVAWVEEAGCNDETVLLGKILQKVEADLARRASLMALAVKTLKKKVADLASRASRPVVPSEGDGNAVSKKLRGILANMRYLVFIDDIQEAELLQHIRNSHLPENNKSGMVIVTTSIRPVANACSSGSNVYTMKCLDHNESENLFRKAFNQARGERVSPAKLDGSTSIIAKIGGLPPALISVVEHLSINYKIVQHGYYDKMVKKFGSHYLAGTHKEFSKLRKALGQCYEGLPEYENKTYMCSLSIFPRNHPIKCKSLVRRLVAEGLVARDDREYLDELINRCIVEPVQISSRSDDVKSCKVDVGIMLEFIIHKSLSTNFVTLIREKEVVRGPKGRIRRLSVQSSTKDKFQEVAENFEMSETIRSLTIIPSQEIREFSKIVMTCKFLRLLDLEGCTGLIDGEFLKGICKLVYLKYLSLRSTDVQKIPSEIKKLQCLQTLDIRETRVEITLPIEVIMLPKLAFLFGKFGLPKMSNRTVDFLSTKSELHTVAGFVVNEWEGSEHIILKAKKLSKVKVRCKDTINKDFFVSLQNCFSSLDSVSITSPELRQEIMGSLDAFCSCIISRMKLFGELDSLPSLSTLQNINNLRKLQLSYTGLTSDDLSMLQHIPFLQYLKLQDNKGFLGDKFHVSGGGFKCLMLLCFKAPKLPKLQFEAGSMQSLTSLHLLCRDISQMQVAEEISKSIKHIKSLNEVILRESTLNEGIVEAWKTAAKSNPNRPCVTTSTCY